MSKNRPRSSVRPQSSKLPWGTILQPNFGLGHQKMSTEEIDKCVSRLHKNKEYPRPATARPVTRDMSSSEITDMMGRLTKDAGLKAPDSRRTQQNSIYRDMGPVYSYAWKGYN